MTCDSIFRVSRYERTSTDHVVTFIEQHRQYSHIKESIVPISNVTSEETLIDIAGIAWDQVKDEFQSWRQSIDEGHVIINKYFNIGDDGSLQFID